MSQFSILGPLSSAIALSPMFGWFLAGLLSVFFVVISFILYYHWKRFGIEVETTKKATQIYFSISGTLLILMFVSLLIYLNSLST